MDRARRQIKEWESLDNEATEFAKQVNAELKLKKLKKQQHDTYNESHPDPHAKKDEL